MRVHLRLPVAIIVLALCSFACGQRTAGGPLEIGSADGPGGGSATSPDQNKWSSPSVAEKFRELARELTRGGNVANPRIRQAIALAQAAGELDRSSPATLPLLIELYSRDKAGDNSQAVYDLLVDYVDESADLMLCSQATQYLLAGLDSREERERMLEQLLSDLGNKNVYFGSELATVLGVLMAEKANADAAGFYFAQAYRNNKYNDIAFSRLAELFPDKLGPEIYLEHLRLEVQEDPTDLEAAMALAQYAERLELYDIAAGVYEYCAGLFAYLFPSEKLPADIYLPWSLSAYNTETQVPQCMKIAQMVGATGRFNLVVESLAAKAAAKMGDGQQATQIFKAIEQKIQQYLEEGPTAIGGEGRRLTPGQVAWFYSLVLPNPQKAVSWSNKAYLADPNSSSASSLLAYALVGSGEDKWARPLLANNPPTQIGQLARAKLQMTDGQEQEAVATLKAAVARDPGSVAAEHARELLEEMDSPYLPPVDPDVVMDLLKDMFSGEFIPTLTVPEEMLSVQFNMRGNKFPYGSDFGAIVTIENEGNHPIIVSDDGLLRGNLRIDASVTGDLEQEIPNLVNRTSRHSFLIEPGKTMLQPVDLVRGPLREMLLVHPQASLDIEFTLYIDPIMDDQGRVMNRLTKLPAVKALVTRPAIELSGKYLRNRFNLISTGHSGQKIQTAQLFVGLLAEQYAMSDRTVPYRFMYADWMPTMFRNALLHESGLLRNPTNGEWVVKVHTMSQMTLLPMDHGLINAVSENLTNANWPVRLMACYLLAKAKTGDFSKVLEWAAKYDSHQVVRQMAAALAAEKDRGRGGAVKATTRGREKASQGS